MENKRVRWAFLAVVCLVILVLIIGSLPFTCRLNTRTSPRNKKLESALEEEKCFYDAEVDQYVFPMFSYGRTLDETLDAMGIKAWFSEQAIYDELHSYDTRWGYGSLYQVSAFGEEYKLHLGFDIDKSEYMGLDTAFTTPLNESPIIIHPDTIVRSFDYTCEYVFDLVSRFTMEYGAPTKETIEGALYVDDIREFFTENDGEYIEFVWEKNGTALMVSTHSTTFPKYKDSNYRYTTIHIRVGLVTPESEFEIFLNSKSRLVTFNGYEIKRTVLDWLVDTDLLDTSKQIKFNDFLSIIAQLEYVPEITQRDNKRVYCYKFPEGYCLYLRFHLEGESNETETAIVDYVCFTTEDDETIFTGSRKDDSISEVMRQLQAALDA